MARTNFGFAAGVLVLLSSPLHAEELPTPKADSFLAGASANSQAIVRDAKGHIENWAEFCAKGLDGRSDAVRDSGMRLKATRQIQGWNQDESKAAVRYFGIACHETGNGG